MRHKEIIYLITVTYSEDSIGNQIGAFTENPVYANEFSVGAVEFYNAAAQGLRPSKVFEIYSFEYNGQEKLRHNGTVYNILRAESKGEKCRLVCERIGADVAEPFTAYLASLTVGVLPLAPVFSPAITSYAVATTNATDIITAISQDPAATVVIKQNNVVMVNGSAATWLAGSNTVTVTVTKGADTLTYTITVTKL